MRRGEQPAAPTVLTAESIVQLTLLHLDSVGSLLDMKPFDRQAEAKRLGALQGELDRQRLQAEQTVSTSNLRQLATGILMYAQDHDGLFPPANRIWAVLKEYGVDERITTHPRTKQPYRYNVAIAAAALTEIEHPAQMVLAYEDGDPWGNGQRIVAFCDGHVETLTAEAWEAARTRSGIK